MLAVALIQKHARRMNPQSVMKRAGSTKAWLAAAQEADELGLVPTGANRP